MVCFCDFVLFFFVCIFFFFAGGLFVLVLQEAIQAVCNVNGVFEGTCDAAILDRAVGLPIYGLRIFDGFQCQIDNCKYLGAKPLNVKQHTIAVHSGSQVAMQAQHFQELLGNKKRFPVSYDLSIVSLLVSLRLQAPLPAVGAASCQSRSSRQPANHFDHLTRAGKVVFPQ